jgi:hypothetical protein
VSTRERATLVLGIVGALLLVLYPLAYRITSEQASPAAARPAQPGPSATASLVAPPPTPTPRDTRPYEPDAATNASWHADATDHRGRNESRFEYDCLANGSLNPVWGTSFYTDDSSVCTAAVHAGLITLAEGGTVAIKILPGLDAYVGSTRNGVHSSSFEKWDGSFMFVES